MKDFSEGLYGLWTDQIQLDHELNDQQARLTFGVWAQNEMTIYPD